MQKKSKSKIIRFFCVLSLAVSFHQSLHGSALSYRQFGNYGVPRSDDKIDIGLLCV